MSNAEHTPLTLAQGLLLASAGILLLPSPWLETNWHWFLLEVIGLLLGIMLLVVHRREALPIPGIVVAFIAYVSVTFALYLIPVPPDVWLALPGRDFYQDVATLLAQTGNPMGWHSLSVDPYATAQTLLSILPALVLFLATISLDTDRLYVLVRLLITVAALQATWGLIQYSGAGGSAHGSYYNRDHYSTLMEFTLPLVIALTAHHMAHRREHDEGRHKTLLAFYLAAATLIFLGGMFAMSRAGIPNLFLAIVLTPLLLSRKVRKTHAALFIVLFLALVMTLAYLTGLVPVINRFIAADPLADARWVMFTQQIEAIQQFFPLGSGPGTFGNVYTAFQPMEQVGAGFVAHAHNDYLELLLETGAIGISLLVFFLGIFLYGWYRLWQHARHPLFMLQVGAGMGLLLSLIHAFFDFNFHTIPHPLIFACLAGIFLKTLTTHKK
ncbi:O-antigen ligase family protein [Thiothrix fructosivorans]|uniref:O-antigen ligase family protein n=1 Tax=Thiothrix fructosivorans TaxID=111770 RepID=A0A8B0SCW2_9GAMM|nr:O-antigen ligase family protein [Thiothrix fructosivorans]MBO0614341.1 O-antigen ligase family protein [Thiothrix fructosivorans]QTX09186.1 O-antigen ligase family protein [Thiothrix fructosivorans]